MINPHEHTHADETECRGCGEPADYAVMLQGGFYPIALCRDCKDDMTTICPSCDQRIWQARGTRLYATSNLYCDKCVKQNSAAVADLDRSARRDESRDDFEQRRR